MPVLFPAVPSPPVAITEAERTLFTLCLGPMALLTVGDILSPARSPWPLSQGWGSKFLAPRRQRGTFLSWPPKLLLLTTLIPVVLQWVLQPTLSPSLHSTTRPKLHLVSYRGLELGRLQTQRLSCPRQTASPHTDSSFPVSQAKGLESFSTSVFLSHPTSSPLSLTSGSSCSLYPHRR